MMDDLEAELTEFGRAWRAGYPDALDVSAILSSSMRPPARGRIAPVSLAILIALATTGAIAIFAGNQRALTGSPPASGAVVPAAHGIALLTSAASDDVCELAEAQGTLVTDARSGLGLRGAGGGESQIRWPYGYTARLQAGRVALVNGLGQVVAYEGDQVQVDGGYDAAGDVWTACPDRTFDHSVRLAPGPSST
jgi:hypothetical protein